MLSKCLVTARTGASFSRLRVRDYSQVGKHRIGILVDWLYVDAVDGVLVWDEGGVEKRESLPDD